MEISVSLSNSIRVPTIVSHYISSKRTQVKGVKPKNKSPNFHPQFSANNYSLQSFRQHAKVRRTTSLSNGFCGRRNNSIRSCSPDSDPAVKKVLNFGHTCYKFLRPYSVFGTILASVSVFARAWVENPSLFKWSLLIKAFPGLIALLFGHAYYNGINQIYDIEIDRVNKPYLPIPAGDLSVKSAWFLVTFYLLSGFLIVGLMNSGLIIASIYALGLFVGTIYSVPPIRLKRFSVSTFLVIATIRGVLLNIGVCYATRAAIGLEFIVSPSLAFITVFATLFTLVISITKDLTDVEGDTKFQISTFASKYGVRNIAFLGSGLLLLNYGGSIAVAILMPEAFKLNLIVPVHTILALCVVFQAWVLEQANYTKEASASFYQFIWRLYFAEYIIFPFI